MIGLCASLAREVIWASVKRVIMGTPRTVNSSKVTSARWEGAVHLFTHKRKIVFAVRVETQLLEKDQPSQSQKLQNSDLYL